WAGPEPPRAGGAVRHSQPASPAELLAGAPLDSPLELAWRRGGPRATRSFGCAPRAPQVLAPRRAAVDAAAVALAGLPRERARSPALGLRPAEAPPAGGADRFPPRSHRGIVE